MSYNFLNYDGKVIFSERCIHDSNIGFESDFSVNGDVGGWTYYQGIHTYGCWNSFLFGTLYGDQAVIGRSTPFKPIEAEEFYTVKLIMKIDIKERVSSQLVPTHGRIMWRTLSNPVWASDKQYDFDIQCDSEWHTYSINLGGYQWWQGDINDLRLYPILSNGRSEDEFYIRSFEILSVDSYNCTNASCDYFTNFTHDCGGIGERGYCKSASLSLHVAQGTTFEFAEDKLYTIEKDVNDVLLVNINDYGFEEVILSPAQNYSGSRLSSIIAKEISSTDVGGYAECDVEYTGLGEFIIYSGTYADDSTVVIGDSALSRYLNFFDDDGINIFTLYTGGYPFSGFRPYSSFKVKTHQLYSLLDSDDKTSFYFDPFVYNVEGGRRDWLETGIGNPTVDVRANENNSDGFLNRSYDILDNIDKTMIDFIHPFNASGRITKIYAGVTLDTDECAGAYRGDQDENRKDNQLHDAVIMFFRPTRSGDFRVLPFEIPIENRDHDSGKLYSATQEYVELDCDIFVNKGDLIGVYNANVYRGKSVSGDEVDALYYQMDGKVSGTLGVRQPLGQGSSGLLLYARSSQRQERLVLNVDLGKRINVKDIEIVGFSERDFLEYNIARCLDINWEVDLFGGSHVTGYVISYRPLLKAYYGHPNIYYGKSCLTDGIKTVPDGLAADGFSVDMGTQHGSMGTALNWVDGGDGVIPSGAKYFQVNGDCEWLNIYQLAGDLQGVFTIPEEYDSDPIAFTLIFPNGTEKLIYRSKIYFKERFNFRSFALSTYLGPFHVEGDADDPRFKLIPYRQDGTDTPWKCVTLDGLEYTPEDDGRWQRISLYLGDNPCVGHMISRLVAVHENSYETPGSIYVDPLGGLNYEASILIENNDQYTQSTATDWTILEHEWEPINASGFRFFCNNHRSTKICEFEVFCIVEGIGSTMAGSIEIMYSTYGNYWWFTESVGTDKGVMSSIGDTPQYIDIVIKPLAEINLSGVDISVSKEDVFMGEKGCQHIFLPQEAKRGVDNEPQVIDFKNVYGRPYDLYVNIAESDIIERGTVFFSLMNNEESITNPIVGADGYYRKHIDYRCLGYDKNVAINCPVYYLKNLIEGAEVWYSHDKEYSWRYHGTIEDGKDIDFHNLPYSTITTLNIPVLNRSKWWKIGFYDPRVTTKVREIQIYFEGEEIFGINFYHHANQDVISSSNSDTAAHLKNNIVDGSYYVLEGDAHIGFELPAVQEIDKIVIYHDLLTEYENSHDIAGIDSSTAVCIHGSDSQFVSRDVIDVSYYEHEVTVVGSGIYYDGGTNTDVYYDFVEDFSECEQVVDEFTSPPPDPDTWTDLVNATIVNEKLYITNSGTIGQVVTLPTFYGDFDVMVDLDVDGAYDNRGWGCYLIAETDSIEFIRVGRTYYYTQPYHRFTCEAFDSSGWHDFDYRNAEDEDTDLKLRIERGGDTTRCFAWDSTDDWYLLCETDIIGSSAVNFKLVSDLTPLANDITTARFDNFNVDTSDSDWGVNTTKESSFTCTSGIGPNGWAYYYDIGCSNAGNASGHKNAKVYPDTSQYYPIDEGFEFTFEFSFQAEYFETVGTHVSVGVLGKHSILSYGYYWSKFKPYFEGAQIVLSDDEIGIFIRNKYSAGASIFESLDPTSSVYYCRLTSDGSGHYHCYVWTDSIDGSNQVANFGIDSSIAWEAGKIGVGSGQGSVSGYNRARGWVSDFNFYCDKHTEHDNDIARSPLRFSGFPGEKLLVEYDNNPQCNIIKEGFDFRSKRFTLDFFLEFNSLPSNDGDIVHLLKCWDDMQPYEHGGVVVYPSSWAFVIEREDSTFKWRFYLVDNNTCTRMFDYTFHPDPNRQYHIYFSRGSDGGNGGDGLCLIDGHQVWRAYASGGPFAPYDIDYSGKDLVIGENLDGWMEEIRVSSDYTNGGSRFSADYRKEVISHDVPVSQYERYYTMELYDSSDNIYYGKNMEVDVMFDNSYSYHIPFSLWSQTYYTYFAVDLGQRHDLEIIRSFPVDTAYDFSLNVNTLFSSKETPDPAIAFSLTEEEQNLDEDFTGQNYDYPFNWTKLDSTNTKSYIIDDTFYQTCEHIGGQEECRAVPNFYLYGDFDFHIDYDLSEPFTENNSWFAGIQVNDINSVDNAVKFERCYVDGGNKYIFWVKDDSSSWQKITEMWLRANRATIRMEREGYIFKVYIKEIEGGFGSFVLFSFYQMQNDFGKEVQTSVYLINDSTAYPKIEIWWDNFTVTESTPLFSTSGDTRWVRVKMLNGDGVLKTIENAGIYPDVSTQRNNYGQYNNYWEDLGTSITSYADAENIALGATVSGSSYVGRMYFDRAVDGVISDGSFDMCWGSEEEDNPWITINFNNVEQIFRIKIYHGYDESDSNTMIEDYRVQTSIDGETFTTIFDIDGNSEYIRIHDLPSPVSAKVVRIYIDKYKAINRFVWAGNDSGYQFWAGAVLREVEIYKYYDYIIINSEDTPIIAIDLQHHYFIDEHSLVGIDAEDDRIDWSNDDSNFAWSNSNLSDPHKVTFGEWGGHSGYAKWVVVKRNTATHYPIVPDGNNPQTDMPDFLKHVIIKASVDELGTKPNPIEYPWMWRSSLSDLSYDYDTITNTGVMGNRSLRIDYPPSTQGDHIRYIEGDHFGWDDVASWRDGFGFFLYIDDIDNLDLEYGYFYFGGYDDTPVRYPVIHRWNMTTVSGTLKTGWNNLNLTFLYADDVIYTEVEDTLVAGQATKDPRRLYSINWGTAGLVFRGKGSPIQLNLEGIYIERNHFEHSCYEGQPGLYMHANDVMRAPVGELNLHEAAIEFWIRPDWNWSAVDIYNDFKYRTLFHLTNVNNDVFGAAVSSHGLEVYYGNILEDFNIFVVGGFNFSPIEALVHLAFVFSNDGTKLDSSGSTIHVYLYNQLLAKSFNTWKISDDKHFNFTLGGQGILLQKAQGVNPNSSAVDGVVSRLKIYNYCKTDFSDSMSGMEDNYKENILKPNNFIEISKDNVTYHKVGSADLPFFFEDVADDDSIPIWVKVTLPKNLEGSEKRTAKIIGSWDIGV